MKNIAVVFGGYSSEYEVSVKSAKFIYDNLKDNSNWNVYEVCISKKKNTVKFKEKIFRLFPVLHGKLGVPFLYLDTI